MNRFNIRRAIFAAVSLVSCAIFATAQTSTTGAIVGVITDPSGAIVPKAEIQLVNVDTNAADRALSNDGGQFVFAGLQPGHYRITVKMAGFRTVSLPNL